MGKENSENYSKFSKSLLQAEEDNNKNGACAKNCF